MYLGTYLIYWTFLLLRISSSTDPCHDYKTLDDPMRSSKYPGESPYFCDSAIEEGWYRSVSGAGPDIPDFPVEGNLCGTQFPIWMDDSLPPSDTQKQVKLCVYHPVYGNCYDTFNINVKNCGGQFNVYELKQTSGCPMRYCFGTEEKCPNDTSSETGFGPDCEVAPTISLIVHVTTGLIDVEEYNAKYGIYVTHKKIKFDCNLDLDTKDKDTYRYRVEWFIDTISLVSFNDKTFAELQDTYLPEKLWAGTYTLGFDVRCTMRAKKQYGKVYGAVYTSDNFYAGLKAQPTAISVKEGETNKEVKISLTVPLGCLVHNGKCLDCVLRTQARQPHYQTDELCETDFEQGSVLFEMERIPCGVEFSSSSWGSPQSLSITGQADDKVAIKDVRESFIHLQALDKVDCHEAWINAKLQRPIQVHVSDKDRDIANKKCTSNNDPYITTFDGERFPNRKSGEFVLYSHKIHPVKVHVLNKVCTTKNTGYCSCGVIIGHYDNFFIANFCDHISEEYKFVTSLPKNEYIARLNCDDDKMKITVGDKNDYKVVLPTGTIVSFQYRKDTSIGYWISSITIVPSIFDEQKSEGLCGYLDGNKANDFKLRDGTQLDLKNVNDFINNWSVKNSSSESLFRDNMAIPSSDVYLRQYCKCTGIDKFEFDESITCHLTEAMKACTKKKVSEDQVKGYFTICNPSNPSNSRKKRNTRRFKREEDDDDDSFDMYPITYSDDYRKDLNRTITWTNGWSEETARTKCTEYLTSSPIVSTCNDLVPNFQENINGSIQDCIDDIQATGGASFVETSLASLSNVCVLQASKYENLTNSNSSSGNSSKSLLDDILDVACLDNCSGNGICVQGKCECLDDFRGPRCNLRHTDAPTFDKNMNSGLCKTDKTTCHSYGIRADNIIPGFFCKARHFKVFKDTKGTPVNGSQPPLVFPGTYVNEFSVKCKVPDSRKRRAANSDAAIADGYFISVSNDGTTYSEEITFVNYNSRCYDCNTTDIACILIEETCGEPAVTTKPPPTDDKDQGLLAYILVAVICIVVVLVIVIIYRIIKGNISRIGTSNPDVRTGIATSVTDDVYILHDSKSWV